MTRASQERIEDILRAIHRCEEYAPQLDSPDVGEMAYDALLRNLAVIGEAVRTLPSDVKEAHKDIPWASIAGLRNVVVHEYFRIERELILDIVHRELGQLADQLRP